MGQFPRSCWGWRERAHNQPAAKPKEPPPPVKVSYPLRRGFSLPACGPGVLSDMDVLPLPARSDVRRERG